MPKPGAILVSTIVTVCAASTAWAQPGASDPYIPPQPAPPESAGAPVPQPQPALQPEPQPEQPGQPMQPMQPPPGSTQATFVSTTQQPWEVLLDRQPACQTPCSIYVPPMRFVTLRSFERSPVLLQVGYLPQSSVIVEGKPLENGKYAAGITFTALSGMALVTGVTLTAVGCATDRDGMCTAGLITGGVGGLGLYLSIQLMRSAVPTARVLPGQPYVSGNTVGLAGRF